MLNADKLISFFDPAAKNFPTKYFFFNMLSINKYILYIHRREANRP